MWRTHRLEPMAREDAFRVENQRGYLIVFDAAGQRLAQLGFSDEIELMHVTEAGAGDHPPCIMCVTTAN